VTRDDLIAHIMHMKTLDPDYARYALRQYNDMLPEMELMAGVREAMKEAK
jgi:hypothetical protein